MSVCTLAAGFEPALGHCETRDRCACCSSECGGGIDDRLQHPASHNPSPLPSVFQLNMCCGRLAAAATAAPASALDAAAEAVVACSTARLPSPKPEPPPSPLMPVLASVFLTELPSVSFLPCCHCHSLPPRRDLPLSSRRAPSTSGRPAPVLSLPFAEQACAHVLLPSTNPQNFFI